MYGRSTLADLINKAIEKELEQYINTEKLNILGQPLSATDQKHFEFDTKELEDFEFKFDLGLSPEFELEGVDHAVFDYHDVIISDKKVEENIMAVRKKLGTQESVEDEVQENDILKLEAVELENELIKEGGFSNTFSVNYSEMTEEAREIFKGKKKGDLAQFDILNLEKDRGESFVRKYFLNVNEDAAQEPQINNEFQAMILDITRLIPAELDQTFFDKYFGEGKISSEEEAREELRKRNKMFYERQADFLFYSDMREKLIEIHDLSFPEEFLKRWLVESKSLPKDKTVEDEFDNFIDSLKWNMIIEKISKKYEIKVDTQEIRQKIRLQVMSYLRGQPMGNFIEQYVETSMENPQQVNTIRNEILIDKIIMAVKEDVTLNKKRDKPRRF